MTTKRYPMRLAAGALLLSVLFFSLPAHSSPQPQPRPALNPEDIAEAYLSHYFGIGLGSPQTEQQFLDLAQTLVASHDIRPLSADRLLDARRAVEYGLQLSQFTEFSLTYSERQAEQAIDPKLSSMLLEESTAHSIAAALEIGMIAPQDLVHFTQERPADNKMLARILMFIADASGKGRNFLGYSDEKEIYGRLLTNYREGIGMTQEKLFSVAKKGLSRKLFTEFQLKNKRYEPKFLSDLKITYSHKSIPHAQQLLALLKREGIRARVQLEPKVTFYEYPAELGAPPIAGNLFKVERFSDDFHLASLYTFDLSFEFLSFQDKQRFAELVKTFAQQGEEGAHALLDSEEKSVYSSPTPLRMGKEQAIYNTVITYREHTLTVVSPAEERHNVSEQLRELAPELSVDSVPLYWGGEF